MKLIREGMYKVEFANGSHFYIVANDIASVLGVLAGSAMRDKFVNKIEKLNIGEAVGTGDSGVTFAP
jgi:hypothetical protein